MANHKSGPILHRQKWHSRVGFVLRERSCPCRLRKEMIRLSHPRRIIFILCSAICRVCMRRKCCLFMILRWEVCYRVQRRFTWTLCFGNCGRLLWTEALLRLPACSLETRLNRFSSITLCRMLSRPLWKCYRWLLHCHKFSRLRQIRRA